MPSELTEQELQNKLKQEQIKKQDKFIKEIQAIEKKYGLTLKPQLDIRLNIVPLQRG